MFEAIAVFWSVPDETEAGQRRISAVSLYNNIADATEALNQLFSSLPSGWRPDQLDAPCTPNNPSNGGWHQPIQAFKLSLPDNGKVDGLLDNTDVLWRFEGMQLNSSSDNAAVHAAFAEALKASSEKNVKSVIIHTGFDIEPTPLGFSRTSQEQRARLHGINSRATRRAARL